MYCNPGFRKGKLMQGRVLYYIAQTESGVITGSDGKRYTFVASEWKDAVPPASGLNVDFDIQEGEVKAIYRALRCCSGVLSEKNKIVAGVLAILLGWLGAHKFYLGYIGPGLFYLLTNIVGWAVIFYMFGLPNFLVPAIAAIEGVIYLLTTDEEFEKTYVIGRKNWF
jgi:TM2 domain-containing membrane protein YozV